MLEVKRFLLHRQSLSLPFFCISILPHLNFQFWKQSCLTKRDQRCYFYFVCNKAAIDMKNLCFNTFKKVVRNWLLKIVLGLNLMLYMDSLYVPGHSTAAMCIKVLWIKQQLQPKLISTRFLPLIKWPKVSWRRFSTKVLPVMSQVY